MSTLLVIRDPDYENEYVSDDDLEIITIDIGSQWNGLKDLASALEDGQEDAAEWVTDTRALVAHLAEDHPVRVRVEQFINEVETHYQ